MIVNFTVEVVNVVVVASASVDTVTNGVVAVPKTILFGGYVEIIDDAAVLIVDPVTLLFLLKYLLL